jgi:hypothetical protein
MEKNFFQERIFPEEIFLHILSIAFFPESPYGEDRQKKQVVFRVFFSKKIPENLSPGFFP